MAKSSLSRENLVELADFIAGFELDPAGFVHSVFPWDEGELSGSPGPDKWQAEILDYLGTRLRELDQVRQSAESPSAAESELLGAIKLAVASGHGVGKTALVAWLILWFISTRPNPQIVVTANTKTQLETKTWRELSIWHKRMLHGDLFTWTATSFYLNDSPETWRANAIPWSRERSEAFAGTHAENVLIIFDEASAIDDMIWEVSEGALTTSGAIFLAFGNPTQNSGRFHECWGKLRHRYKTFQVDSRTARMANQHQLQQWILDYGEDSDFVRIRVRGEFPRSSSNQFIPNDIVAAAFERRYMPEHYNYAPIVLGVDPAYMGDDQSVLYLRQGLQTISVRKFRHLDGIDLAGQVCRMADEYRVDLIFLDAVGVGASCSDQLKRLRRKFIPVNAGWKPINSEIYFNKRVEMWGEMREWLKNGGSLAPVYDSEGVPYPAPVMDRELFDDLIGPTYGFSTRNQFQLEGKADMKKRGLSSPDSADALALTFAFPLPPNFKSSDRYDYLNTIETRRRRSKNLDPVTGV